jgi:hypothetical protein
MGRAGKRHGVDCSCFPVLSAHGTWTIRYIAAETSRSRREAGSSCRSAGWTAPQLGQPGQPGYVSIADTSSVNETVIAGNTIELRLGGSSKNLFQAGDTLTLVYGFGGGAARGQVQPTGPDVAAFWVSSDPAGSVPAPIGASPTITVTVGSAGSPDHIALAPASLALTAGAPDTVSVIVYDASENKAPLASAETLTLWTDRAGGRFSAIGGGTIFEITVPAGADSARFTFTDVTSGGAGHIRADRCEWIRRFARDRGSFGDHEPRRSVRQRRLDRAPGIARRERSDSTSITPGAVRDAYGNVVAAGSVVTVSGSGVTPLGDQDAGTPGVQWTTGAPGNASGLGARGHGRGRGIPVAVSVQGSATGSTPIPLAPGVPRARSRSSPRPTRWRRTAWTWRASRPPGSSTPFGNMVADGERYTVAATLGSIVATDRDAATAGVSVVESSGGSIAFGVLGRRVSLGTANVTATSVRERRGIDSDPDRAGSYERAPLHGGRHVSGSGRSGREHGDRDAA